MLLPAYWYVVDMKQSSIILGCVLLSSVLLLATTHPVWFLTLVASAMYGGWAIGRATSNVGETA